jgi:hypothetical protein
MGEANSVRAGGCLCGSVRYEMHGDPKMNVICHCLTCQKLSGAGHAFHMLVPEAGFSVSGTPKGFDSIADSGNRVTSSFCPQCGSQLFSRTSGFPGMLAVRVASLDEPLALTPQMAVYTKRLQPWDHVEPAVPSFPAMPPMAQSA